MALKFLPFLAWRHRVTALTCRADLVAGLVSALVVLPQGVAYATLAGLPPQFGLYCAMLPAVVAALWGSSWHQISGPTNALSLVVFATIAPLALPQSGEYITLVLTLALLVGVMQFAMGVARLGTLVNFISHTVIVGFTAGAGLLIIAAQLRNFFGVPVPGGAGFFESLHAFGRGVIGLDPAITAIGTLTLVVGIASKRLWPRVPYMIVAMVAGSVAAVLLAHAGIATVPTLGALPSALPAVSAPSFDPETWRKLVPAALALTVLGLTEAVAIARAIAVKSGQRIDGNQEFIGQGLSNIAGAFTSAYPSSGSFNRSGVNFEAGAATPLAAVFSAGFLIMILFAVAPLAAYLPLAVMAALLFAVAWGLIDFAEMRRIARTSRGDLAVLLVTFVSTLTIQLEFAIFVGVLASLLVYLNRTTHPALTRVMPDAGSPQRRFIACDVGTDACPQLDLLRIDGSLFFGAVEHVQDELDAARAERPGPRHVLLVCSGVNFIDVSGCDFLVNAARRLRDQGVALYLCNLKPGVRETLERGGYVEAFGSAAIFATKARALETIYPRLVTSTCAACGVRAFIECQHTLPDGTPRAGPPVIRGG
ncbi:MAG: SulP family inorganic anion transporter [Casimicrobiaceae bacterium]